jgi:hypothetical protein
VPASRVKATPVPLLIAQIPEDHGLYVHGRTPGVGDVVQFAVDLGAVVVPALENGHHRTPQLFPGIGRELAADAGTNQSLETQHQFLEVVGVEFGIELHALLLLERVDDHFEGIVFLLRYRFEAHHHVAVHLYETAVRVPGKTFVAGLARQPGNRLVIEAEIQDGVHHARHRSARARAHRQQQRIGGVAEFLAHFLFDESDALADVRLDQLDHGILTLLAIDGAHLGADREAGGYEIPRRHISARLAPLPPSRFFIVASPSVRAAPNT